MDLCNKPPVIQVLNDHITFHCPQHATKQCRLHQPLTCPSILTLCGEFRVTLVRNLLASAENTVTNESTTVVFPDTYCRLLPKTFTILVMEGLLHFMSMDSVPILSNLCGNDIELHIDSQNISDIDSQNISDIDSQNISVDMLDTFVKKNFYFKSFILL